jgi:hypothetical protein
VDPLLLPLLSLASFPLAVLLPVLLQEEEEEVLLPTSPTKTTGTSLQYCLLASAELAGLPVVEFSCN